jgi:uncharacterized coiled-coil protein SlyX
MEKEVLVLRAALDLKEKQVRQLETWMRDCDRMDALEHELAQKDSTIKSLEARVRDRERELEKTTTQRDALREHIDDRDACIDGLHDFIDTERLQFERRIKTLWENETTLAAKLTDAETTIRDLRASQGRPFVDHRDAPTFKDKAALLFKENAQLKCKYHAILLRYNSAAEAAQQYEAERDARRAREEETRRIEQRIQKNLGTATANAETQTPYLPAENTEASDAAHRAEVLSLKHAACLETIASLRHQLDVRKKTIDPIRAHIRFQLRAIDILRDDAAKMHATIRSLRRGLVARPRRLRSIEDVLIRKRVQKPKPKRKKHAAKGRK